MPTFKIVAGANGAESRRLLGWVVRHSKIPLSLIPMPLRGKCKRPGRFRFCYRRGPHSSANVGSLLSSGQSFLVETTLYGNTYIRMMIRARALGYTVVLFYVGTTDVSINMDRVRNRVANGGHDVPEEDQLRRYPRSFANLKKAFELADEAVLYDNSTRAGHVELAVKGDRGIKVFEPLPDWATFLRN